MKKTLALAALLVLAFVLGATHLLSAQTLGQQDKQKQQDKKIEEEQPKPQGRTGIRVAVNQIKVDVTVQNSKGDLIQGLKKENFKIYEDKVQQEIANFTSIEAPMTVVLVTEYSNAVNWQFLYDVLMASYTFVEQMRKDDWVAVMAYDMRPEILVDFTQNKMEVYNALRRLNFPAFSESNMYDTVWDVLDRIEEVDSKVAIVLIASGIDTFSKKNLGETLKRVQNTNAVIYPVSTGGNFRARYESDLAATSRLDLYQADSTLKQFAKSTGGAAFFPRFITEYPGIFQTISALLRHQYSISYTPTNTKMDGKLRKIKVEVEADIDGDGKPDKLKAQHREGYLAAKENSD
ncbi:MAG: VWA domain-containing protein [Acidobacteria bacterium]|nr:MAG: VWA domain-containing protein [Acidobacteriota bacterium]